MRGLPSLLALGLLAACSGGAGLGTGGGALDSMGLFFAGPQVTGPEGYCVDADASRPRDGFAVFASCAVLGDAEATRPVLDALVTVQMGERASAGVAGNEPALEALLTSPEGVTLLSASNDPATVAVDSVSSQAGLVTVHFTDFTPGRAAGLDPEEWRAFLDLRGRLTTVSVRGLSRAPITREEGMILLGQAVAALRAANGEGTVSNAETD